MIKVYENIMLFMHNNMYLPLTGLPTLLIVVNYTSYHRATL